MGIERTDLPISSLDTHSDATKTDSGAWLRLKDTAVRKSGVVGHRPSLQYDRTVQSCQYIWRGPGALAYPFYRPYTAGDYTAAGEQVTAAWAKDIIPLKFLFDPNYGSISGVFTCRNDLTVVRAEDMLQATPPNTVLPAGSMFLMNLPYLCGVNNATQQPCPMVQPLADAAAPVSLFVFNGITYAFGGQQAAGGAVSGINLLNKTPIFQPVLTDVPPTNVSLNYSLQRVPWNGGLAGFMPQGAAPVRDRVVYFRGPSVYWSDRLNPLQLNAPTAAAAEIIVAGEELENITAIAELSTSADGSPVQSVCSVWTETHQYLLLGDPLQSAEYEAVAAAGSILGSLQINRLNIESGCISQASVCRTPYGAFWVGRDDVWFMPDGSLPIRVGTKIRDIIRNQPGGLKWKIHAEYYDNQLRISMFSAGAGPSLYSGCDVQYWLDLSEGPPQNAESARWFGPQAILTTHPAGTGTWAVARDTRAAQDGALYYLQPWGNLLGSGSTVWQLSLCTMDKYRGYDNQCPDDVVVPWVASLAYSEGDIIRPAQQSGGSFLTYEFYVAQAGTSGSTQPNWATAMGASTGIITDGTVIWRPRYATTSGLAGGTYTLLPPFPGKNAWLDNGFALGFNPSLLAPELNPGNLMNQMLLDGLELAYISQKPMALVYNSHPAQTLQQTVLKPNFAPGTANTAGLWTGERLWSTRLLPPQAGKRFNANAIKPELYGTSGIVLVSGLNNDIRLDLTDGVTGFSFQTPINPGVYADLFALATQIVTQLQTAYPADWKLQYSGPAYWILYDNSSNYGVTVYPSSVMRLFGFTAQIGTGVVGASVLSQTTAWSTQFNDMQMGQLRVRHRTFNRNPS
ncbi:MAG: hypothetical protein QM729_21475 [Solirubrobacterales bacterium]